MQNTEAITLSKITKSYRLYKRKNDRIKEAFHPLGKKYHKVFYALQDIDFSVKKGESWGIIGLNGAGKSTLLKIICGVLTPTSGFKEVNGKISSILELGAGFNPEYTGHENIFFYGAVMGFSKAEMEEKFDEIISFADIGEFINQPIKNYSSGMRARLAFSVATSMEPDILILDEVLSVGDMYFQAKCVDRMTSMINNLGTTILFVSHSIPTIKSICQKAILLKNGKIVKTGKADEVTDYYFKARIEDQQKTVIRETNNSEPMQQKDVNETDSIFNKNETFIKRAEYNRIQNGKARFVNVQLLDEHRNIIDHVEFNQKIIIRMAIEIEEDMPKISFGYVIINNQGIRVVYYSSSLDGNHIVSPKRGEKYIIDLFLTNCMAEGIYNITASLGQPNEFSTSDFCDRIPLAYQFEVTSKKSDKIHGSVYLNEMVRIKLIDD